jgi:hypothetical protein
VSVRRDIKTNALRVCIVSFAGDRNSVRDRAAVGGPEFSNIVIIAAESILVASICPR